MRKNLREMEKLKVYFISEKITGQGESRLQYEKQDVSRPVSRFMSGTNFLNLICQ